MGRGGPGAVFPDQRPPARDLQVSLLVNNQTIKGEKVMRRRALISYLASFVILGALLPVGIGHAADIQKRTLRLSTAGNKGNPQVLGAELDFAHSTIGIVI